MSVLIGLCGYAGVGKSTAIEFMRGRRNSKSIYLGAVVIEEVARRGLPQTPESERSVRVDLRSDDKAALARVRSELITSSLASGRPVLIDAVVVIEEFDFLRGLVGIDRFYLLEVQATFDGRCARLVSRPERSLTRDQLTARDIIEKEKLGVEAVFAEATHRIANDGSIEEFEARLDAFLDKALPTPVG